MPEFEGLTSSRRRVLALALRIVRQFRRDRRTLALLIVVPLVVLSLLAYLMRGEESHLRVDVVNLDEGGRLSDGVLTRLAEGGFKLHLTNAGEAREHLKNGESSATLTFPAGFSAAFAQTRRANLDLRLEGSRPQHSGKIVAGVNRALAQTIASLAAGQENLPITVDISYQHGGQDFDTLDYFAPAFIGMFVFVFVYLLTSVSFLRERTQGTMERLWASPLSRAEMVLGYMLGFSVFALLQSLIVLLFSAYVLRVHYSGNLAIVFLIEAILTVAAVNLGIFLSAFARNEFQAVQFMPLVIIPQILLGGVIFPVGDMAPYLRWISHFLPLTYANAALRDVMVRGYALTHPDVAANVGVLLAFAAAIVVLGALTLRRESA